MAKRMNVTLTVRDPQKGETGEVVWSVWSDNRKPGGWTFRSHDGCERHSAGNWTALVERVRASADNYGCDARIS